MNKKKKWLKLSRFDRKSFDMDYLDKLDEKSAEWMLNFFDETINGKIVKDRNSVFSPKDVREKKLKQIEADPVEHEKFLKAKRKREMRDGTKKTPLNFVKIYMQQEANRLKQRRRGDASSATVDVKATNQADYDSKKENLIAQGLDRLKKHEDITEFMNLLKEDRADLYIWRRLTDICAMELEFRPGNESFTMIKEDLLPRNKEYMSGKIRKANYHLYLYSCLYACDLASKTKDGKKQITELKNIFSKVLYPIKNGKIKKESGDV